MVAGVTVYSVVADRGSLRRPRRRRRPRRTARDHEHDRARATDAKQATDAATYTVKPGDTLSAIAEKTGVSLDAHRASSTPTLDAQALHAGQKIKLAP